jgi:hypothetical protein
MAAEDAARAYGPLGKHDPSFDIGEPERYRQGRAERGGLCP